MSKKTDEEKSADQGEVGEETSTQPPVRHLTGEELLRGEVRRIEIPLSGGETGVVYLRQPDAEMVMAMSEGKEPGDRPSDEEMYLAVGRCLFDEGGNRLFSDEQCRLVGKMPAGAFTRIVNEFNDMAGFIVADVESLGLEARVKNS